MLERVDPGPRLVDSNQGARRLPRIVSFEASVDNERRIASRDRDDAMVEIRSPGRTASRVSLSFPVPPRT